MAQQFTLPDWARLYGQQIDLRTSPYWAPQDAGDGSGGLGNADGSGYYAPLEQFAATQGSGENMIGARRADRSAAMDWLKNTGQSLYESNSGQTNARWLQDAQGNITAEPQIVNVEDDNFWTGALLAGALTGANLYGAYGGGAAASAGGGAASGAAPAAGGAGAAGGGAAGMTAEQVAMLAANGMTDAQIAAMATAAGDAAMAGSLTGAGMGGGGGLLSGLLNGTDASKIGSGLLDYAAKNPKVVGGLLGGLTGATGGTSSGSTEAPYSGPMPTISRGNWQPRAQAQMMALPQVQAPEVKQGAQGSGLWRFLGGK